MNRKIAAALDNPTAACHMWEGGYEKSKTSKGWILWKNPMLF